MPKEKLERKLNLKSSAMSSKVAYLVIFLSLLISLLAIQYYFSLINSEEKLLFSRFPILIGHRAETLLEKGEKVEKVEGMSDSFVLSYPQGKKVNVYKEEIPKEKIINDGQLEIKTDKESYLKGEQVHFEIKAKPELFDVDNNCYVTVERFKKFIKGTWFVLVEQNHRCCGLCQLQSMGEGKNISDFFKNSYSITKNWEQLVVQCNDSSGVAEEIKVEPGRYAKFMEIDCSNDKRYYYYKEFSIQ